jgi:glyoxylase-like metal-dependent hydrolase (beta-lactamase superfamily II)
MSGADTTTEAFANTRPSSAEDLPDYAPIPRPAFGPALNEQGYYVGRVERNLYWVTDGTYQSAFLTTSDGVVLLDAPPTIGHNIQRAVDEIAAANGVSNRVTHLIYSHHHADHVGASSLFDKNVARRRATCCCEMTTRPGRRRKRPLRTAPRWRSAANASSWRGTDPITRRTTSSSTCPTTTR